MNRISLLLIALAVALTGCTHVRTIDPNGEEPFAVINQLGTRKTATVTLTNARKIQARNLQVTFDSTSWFNVETDHFESVATLQIQEVRFYNRGRGAGDGFGFGFLAGALVGAIAGSSEGDDGEGCFPLCMSADQKAILGGVLLGSIGAVLGIPIGASIGSTDKYRFKVPAPKPEIAVFVKTTIDVVHLLVDAVLTQ